jgi:hypothetical protein
MERCFPTANRLVQQNFLELQPSDRGVFVLYQYELNSGERFRNIEVITVVEGLIVEAQEFFGLLCGADFISFRCSSNRQRF